MQNIGTFSKASRMDFSLQRENLAFQNMQFLNLSLVWGQFGFPGSGSTGPVKSVSGSTKLSQMPNYQAQFTVDLIHVIIIYLFCAQFIVAMCILVIVATSHSHSFHTLQSPCSLKLLHTMELTYVSSYKSKPPVHAVL